MSRTLRKNSRIRRLALEKVRELRRAGMSYREIGHRFKSPDAVGIAPASAAPAGCSSLDRNTTTAALRNGDPPLFLALLDAVPMGLLLFDATERLLHANARALQLLNNQNDSVKVREEAHSCARTLHDLIRQQPTTTSTQELMVREVRTNAGMYRLHGSHVRPGICAQNSVVLIAIETVVTEPISTDAVRQRFGLTRKEAQVAILLGQRKSTLEIAQELHISSHTARHHVRRVLAKLGIHSRRAVAAILEAERNRTEANK